ncbi:phosphopantetheine-binding protein, partial [Flavobacterium notoginsengisoli]|uniref:phosphopantetheine-binding protein n=1 Tax=Flavobacterium notoginsengisoli TaxID=1478199 RepID=UPI0036442B09
QDLLGLDQVGIYDNFFELGGHSLLATRLVSMIRRELKTEVSIRDVFEHTTISELGGLIDFFALDFEEEAEEDYNKTIEI